MLLCAAAFLYNDWLLQFLVPTGLPQADSYVSETFAADQPYRLLFSAVELTCVGAVIVGAGLAARSAPRGPALAGWGAVIAFGAFSVLDVLLPMGCAPSVERGCPPDNIQHTTTSGLVEFALFASMAMFGLAARRPGTAPASVAGRSVPWLLPVSMALAIATIGPYLGHPGGQGIAQRIHLVTIGVWLLLLAAEAHRRPVVRKPDGASSNDHTRG
ncbi:DUF998 domain-containing protein [Streptomyces sp. NPDC101150]|uniref:DUF998 domain-containing protein n=1 Tax=Streptomyces sp. NPDC101150 TaxID=3366114 RepID=UPI0038284EF2